MKRLLTTACLLLLLAPAAIPQTKPAAAPAFAPFWAKFKAAVVRGDKQAVASMTKLPFLFDGRERDRAGFIRIYPQLFDRKVTRCFATGKTQREGDLYEIFCGDYIFYFGVVEGQYKLTEFGVND